MRTCVVLLHSMSDFAAAVELVNYSRELYAGEYRLIYSVQGGEEVVSEIVSTLESEGEYCLGLGKQSRTLEECLLYYIFSGITPDLLYDPFVERALPTNALPEWHLCYELRKKIDNCLTTQSSEPICQFYLASLLGSIEYLESRASRMASILRNRLSGWQDFVALESSLIRGGVELSLLDMSVCNNLKCGSVNNYAKMLQDYRVLDRTWEGKHEIIDDRKSLLVALSMDYYGHDNVSLRKFLLVNSAYCFSVSQHYAGREVNIAGMFLFRSFELILLAEALRLGGIKFIVVRNGVKFLKSDNLPLVGTGYLWHVVKEGAAVANDVARDLDLFIKARNISYSGHGFIHMSNSALAAVWRSLYRLASETLGADDWRCWKEFKRCSRTQQLKDVVNVDTPIEL